jgi:inhibitor of cysteine peptidase
MPVHPRTLLWAVAWSSIPASSGAATAPAERVITEAQNRQTITLGRTTTLILRLEANSTTGYEWQIVMLPRNLKLVATAYEAPAQAPSAPLVAGAGGAQRLAFKAVAAGRGTLRLVYRQPWNRGARPERTFQVTVLTR